MEERIEDMLGFAGVVREEGGVGESMREVSMPLPEPEPVREKRAAFSWERISSFVEPPLNCFSICSRAVGSREGESQDLLEGVEEEVEDWSSAGGVEVVVGLYFIAFCEAVVPNARLVRLFRETLQLNWSIGIHRVAVDGVREKRGGPLVRRRASAALRSSISLIEDQ